MYHPRIQKGIICASTPSYELRICLLENRFHEQQCIKETSASCAHPVPNKINDVNNAHNPLVDEVRIRKRRLLIRLQKIYTP